MHVREVPHIIFNEMVLDRQEVSLHEYARLNYPNDSIYRSELTSRSDHKLIIGETIEDCWLRFREYGGYTCIDVYDSMKSIIHDVDSGSAVLGKLIAGSRETGTWAYGLGEEYEQTVWLKTPDKAYVGSEGLNLAKRSLVVLGSIAVRAQELLASGVFETSVYYSKEVDTGS